MAVKHRIVSASTGKTVKTASNTKGERGSALPLRIGAAALWIFAIVLEVLALCAMTEKIVIPFLVKLSPLVQGIVLLVIDFIAVVAGAQLWKKANRIAPASEANALKFWLWNNMGVIACAAAFVPFIVLLLLNNDTDKRTKAVGIAAAAILLIIGGLASYDFDPVSAESYAQAAGTQQVYWTPHGKRFHTHEDCPALSRTEELTAGSVQEAIDAGRETMCKICEKRDGALMEKLKQAAKEKDAA
nr:hypothetical protein [Treponema socranskii]